MKRILLLSASLTVCGLLAGCGAKGEVATYENEGYTLTFSCPEGFFTRSEDVKDYLFGQKDGVAYVGKDFTMQVTLGNRFGKAEYWETFKKDKSEQDRHGFFEEVRFDGAIDAYRFYWEPRLAYAALIDSDDGYADISFYPNELKSTAPGDLMNSEKTAGFLELNKALAASEAVQEIVKSVKIVKKTVNE